MIPCPNMPDDLTTIFEAGTGTIVGPNQEVIGADLRTG